jgi:hypothetical protein
MASICNDERVRFGVLSGHERKTLKLSGQRRHDLRPDMARQFLRRRPADRAPGRQAPIQADRVDVGGAAHVGTLVGAAPAAVVDRLCQASVRPSIALKRSGIRIIAVDSEISAKCEALDNSVRIRKACTLTLLSHGAWAGTPLPLCWASQADTTPPPARVNSDSAASSVQARHPPPAPPASPARAWPWPPRRAWRPTSWRALFAPAAGP